MARIVRTVLRVWLDTPAPLYRLLSLFHEKGVEHLANLLTCSFSKLSNRYASVSTLGANVHDIRHQSHGLWYPIHMTSAFKVHAIENTQNISLFQKSLRNVLHEMLALQYLATVRDHNTLIVLAHLPTVEVVYFAITHLAGNRHRINASCLGCEVTRGGVRHLDTGFAGIKHRARSFQVGAVAKHVAVDYYLAAHAPIIVAVDGGQGVAAREHAVHVDDLFCIEVSQVERCQGTAKIEHGAHVGNVCCIEVGQVERCQGAAAKEHESHVNDVFGIEAAQVEGCQGTAGREHAVHIGNVCSIEAGQVERCQGTAAMEHAAHVGDLFSIEAGQVERCQGTAAMEHAAIVHAAHVGDLFSIEVSYVLDVLQFHAVSEPPVCGGGAVVGKGRIEHSVLDLFLMGKDVPCPARIRIFFCGDVVLGSRTCAAQVVVVERECGVGLG